MEEIDVSADRLRSSLEGWVVGIWLFHCCGPCSLVRQLNPTGHPKPQTKNWIWCAVKNSSHVTIWDGVVEPCHDPESVFYFHKIFKLADYFSLYWVLFTNMHTAFLTCFGCRGMCNLSSRPGLKLTPMRWKAKPANLGLRGVPESVFERPSMFQSQTSVWGIKGNRRSYISSGQYRMDWEGKWWLSCLKQLSIAPWEKQQAIAPKTFPVQLLQHIWAVTT